MTITKRTLQDIETLLPYLYGITLLGIFAAVWSWTFAEHLIAAEDGALYYVLGKALHLGQGYLSMNTPAATPVTSPPPGYPALVAATMALWSSDMLAIRTANAGYLGGAIVLLFVLFRRLQVGRHLAFVVALGVALNAHLLSKSMVMMSESSFLLFSTASLLLFTCLHEEDFRKPQIYLLLLCLVAAYYIRSLGVALVVAVCAEFVWLKRWRFLAFTGGGFLLSAMPWYLWGRSKGGSAYVGQLLKVDPYQHELGVVGPGDLVLRVVENFQRYIYREIPDGLLYFIDRNWSVGPTTMDWIIGIGSLALVAYGLRQLASQRRLIALYLAATASILMLWPPVWAGTRFLQPVIPLLLLGAFCGLSALGIRLFSAMKTSWRFHPLMLLPVLCLYGPDLMHLRWLATQTQRPDNWANYLALANWVHGNTPPESIVACRRPLLFHLYSDRRTVLYPFTADKAALVDGLREEGVTFVVLDHLGYTSQERYLLPAVTEYEGQFPVVHKIENPSTWLMAFRPDG